MVYSAVFAQTLIMPETSKDDFEKMTFEVEVNKDSYVMSEPIFVRFKFSNKTGLPQTTYSPSFLQESKLKVNFNGRTSVFDHLSSINGPGIRFAGTIPAGGFSTGDEMLSSPLVGTFFPEPGSYKFQFVLHSPGGDKTIESNVLEVTIEKPTGINKEAFDFIKKHQEFFGLSSWTYDGKNSEALLERLVNDYGQSVYGEIAISSLGFLYLAKGEIEKAKVEFDKIKSSENPIIAKEANRSLADITKRKADLQNLEKQKQKPQ